MGFIDEIKHIKQQKSKSDLAEEQSFTQREKEKFQKRMQSIIDNLENVKEEIKKAAENGEDTYTVVSRIVDVQAPIFGNTTNIYAITEGITLEGHPRPRLGSRAGSRLKLKRYQCVESTLLISEYHSQGFNGRWYFLNTKAGKSVILDQKLAELWDRLLSLGVRPFFSGQIGSGDLRVQF